jgi:hypothetical protein
MAAPNALCGSPLSAIAELCAWGRQGIRHACIRCPLRLDPAQQPLLNEIEANTQIRLDEAHEKGWLGEVAALDETLHHIDRKRTQLPT